MPLGTEESRFLRYSAYGFLIKSPDERKMWKPENEGRKKCRIAYTTYGKYRP